VSSPAAPPSAASRLGALLSGRLGFLSVAVGLGVYGVAAYVFLGLAGQALGVEAFAPLSVLWTLLNAVGIGLFLPFEQELGRTTASLRARALGNGGVVRAVARVAVVLLAAVTVLCLVAWPLLTRRLFHGDASLVPLLLGAMAGMAVAYVARGLLAGSGRYAAYGAQFVVDGVLRAAGAGALYLAGVREVWAFALVLVVAPLAAVLVTTPRRPPLVVPGEAPVPGTVRRAMVVLITASLASQLLANAGPLIVQLRATPAEEVLSGQFLAAITIARLPVFVFSAVQAVLLPGLAALVGLRDAAGFRRRLGLVAAATAAIGVGGTVAVWAWGDVLVPLLFGDAFGVGRSVVTLLALSGALFMLAQLAAQALLALTGERAVVVGWVAGAVALCGTALLPGELTSVAVAALVVGSAVSLLVLVGALLLAVRAWSAGLAAAPAPGPAAG
jgi:O-antigen/teichoic acid export membrane protein